MLRQKNAVARTSHHGGRRNATNALSSTHILPRTEIDGQGWTKEMKEAREQGVKLARRGKYREAARFLDAFYRMGRALTRGGAR